LKLVHKHHIIPRHMGGTDDPSNIIEVTVEEHAELHRRLYKSFGHIEDKLAWKMLLGQAKDPEVWAMKSRLGAAVTNKDGGPALGKHWYHNPNDPTQQKMLNECPEGWVSGRGKLKTPNRSHCTGSERQRESARKQAKVMGDANGVETRVKGKVFKSRVDAAKYFGVSKPTILRWVRAGA
jgi:hypothetical protein